MDIQNTFRTKSMTMHWLINVLSIIVVVVLISVLSLSVLIKMYYYNTVQQNLESRISTSTAFFMRYESSGAEEFAIAAQEFVNDIVDKHTVEVQAFDSNGKMIASSTGFFSEDVWMPDYTVAQSSADYKGQYIGKNENNESIIAMTTFLPKENGVSVGAIRYVASMKDINSQIFWNVMLVCMMGLIIIVVAGISGRLFLRSIIKPISAITEVAYRISAGNFDDRLPVNGTDEIGRLCDTINYMAAELSSTEKLKNEFISSVSHELRTPLTVIKGWGETVRQSAQTDPELVERGMNVIAGEAERLSGLVEDLLDFSRMQAGRFSLKKEKIDILAELGEAVYMYKESAKQNDIKVIYVEPEMLPPVMADASRLKQVFINILDNAVKYSNKGGEVLVEASQYDVYVQVTISDTGCGIAPEDLGRVKEKFYKANQTVRGSGIGLAIADEIIKQHDGILDINSIQGAGTKVSIILPYIKNEDKEQNS